MRIQQLNLYSNKLQEQRDFYREVLGLIVTEESEKQISVQVGQTQLNFLASEQNCYYHFAFNISSNKASEALAWLKQRVEILPFLGNELVDFSNWNAEAMYFYDPAGNIVELIARKDLRINTDGVFDPKTDIISISEIGLPTTQVAAVFEHVSTTGVQRYDGNLERFCAAGDEEGLFIIVDKNSKKWIPCDDPCVDFPLSLDYQVNNQSYQLHFPLQNKS